MPEYHQYAQYSIPVCKGRSARDLYNLPDDEIDRLRCGTMFVDGSCMDPDGGFRGTPFADRFTYLSDQEVRELIDFHKANRSSILHLFQDNNVPVKNQNGHGYSHTEDTEVLTEKGWTPWPEWNRKDLLATVDLRTNLMEYQAPTEWHAYEYDDEMYYSTNRRLDFGVTKNHRMIVRKWDEANRTLSNRYTEQRADELGWYVGMMAAPSGHIGTTLNRVTVEHDRTYNGDDFIALLALIVSDGYAGGAESTRDRVSFCNFQAHEREEIQALAARTGFKEQPGRKGIWTRYSVPLANWVRANCYVSIDLGAKNKRVPQLVQVASTNQIKHFLNYFHDRNRNATAYYSTSKQLIDDLQILHLKLGKRSSICHRGPRESEYNGKTIRSSGEYTLCVSTTDRLCIDRKKHIETDHYKGLVYCATVPNGTLVTRRNGSVLISGNCWAYGAISCIEANRLAQGTPYVELSPHSVAAGVMKGADRGGWANMALKWADDKGVVPDSLWPKHSRDYRLWDNPEIANAAIPYRPGEWVDIEEGDMQAVRSLLAMNFACGLGLLWWGHLIMFGIIDYSDKYGWLYGQRNSHGPNFGADGWAFHTESSAKHGGGSTVLVA